MEIDVLLEYDNRSQLREWLQANHTSANHCWVVSNRSKAVRDGAIRYIEIVEEALCFGWIDSTCKRLDDGRTAQRLSPRRKGSHWTELNRMRCADLEAQGLMTDAGRRALAAGTADK